MYENPSSQCLCRALCHGHRIVTGVSCLLPRGTLSHWKCHHFDLCWRAAGSAVLTCRLQWSGNRLTGVGGSRLKVPILGHWWEFKINKKKKVTSAVVQLWYSALISQKRVRQYFSKQINLQWHYSFKSTYLCVSTCPSLVHTRIFTRHTQKSEQ